MTPEMILPDLSQQHDLLHDRVILISGAARGIGAAAARTCAAHGAHLVLLGRNHESLRAVVGAIENAGFPTPDCHALDLSQATAKDYADLATVLSARYGRLDGLLNNASILGPRTPLANYPDAEFRAVLEVNVTAAFSLTRALLPLLEAATEASVIFTSSGVGRQGRPNWGAYAVSKFATEGLMQVWASELQGSTVRVNCINPGATRTAMRAAAYPEEDALHNPAPDAIMPLYLYLLSALGQGQHGLSLDAQAPR